MRLPRRHPLSRHPHTRRREPRTSRAGGPGACPPLPPLKADSLILKLREDRLKTTAGVVLFYPLPVYRHVPCGYCSVASPGGGVEAARGSDLVVAVSAATGLLSRDSSNSNLYLARRFGSRRASRYGTRATRETTAALPRLREMSASTRLGVQSTLVAMASQARRQGCGT